MPDDPLAGRPRLIFGSEDSLDLDVVYLVDAIPDIQSARRLCRSDTENRNLVVVEDGVVVDCFKGSPDETHNALLRTHALHPQAHPLPLSAPLPRIVPLKAVRAVRITLSLLSRTPARARIKAALTSFDQQRRLDVLRQLDFTALPLSADVAKSIAFQLGQLRALIDGDEHYTKSAVAAALPDLAPLLARDPGADRAALNALRDDLLGAMAMVDTQADGDLNVFCYRSSALPAWNQLALQSRGVVIDMRRERCLVQPYDKFFQLDEVDGWRREDFAGQRPDEIVEKVDGSLVSLFRHQGALRFVSKGRFDSAQAQAALRLSSQYDLSVLDLDRWDHVFEVVCDDNRFPRGFTSVRYDAEALYLIGLRDRHTREMASYEAVVSAAQAAGLRHPRRYTGTFEQAVAACADPRWHNEEGWIARFGERRVKLKRASYRKTSNVINGIKHGSGRIFRQYLKMSAQQRAAFGDFMPPDLRPHLDAELAPYAAHRARLEEAAAQVVSAHFDGDIRALIAHIEASIAPAYRGVLLRLARGQPGGEATHRALAWTLRHAPERARADGWDLSLEEGG